MENIDIDIDIDKEISENIDIDKISNRLEFGISNRARPTQLDQPVALGPKSGPPGLPRGEEEFKIPMFKIPTFIIPMVQNTNEALSKYHLKVHNTNKLKRVKFVQFKIPTGWYYEHSVHNTNYNCCHG